MNPGPAATRAGFGRWPLAIACAWLITLPALAQTPPDSGQILRELERPAAPALQPPPTLTRPAQSPGTLDDRVRFTLRSTQLIGADAIELTALNAELARLAGREVTLADLQEAARRLTQALRDAGFALAHVVIPAQDIKNGVVTFQVLAGTISQVHVDNRSCVDNARIEAMARAQVKADVPLARGAIDRTLLLLTDLPGTGPVVGILEPGDRVGSSKLGVRVSPGKAIEGALMIDNRGNRYMGQRRVSGQAVINSPTGIGDRLRLDLTASDQALYYGTAAYDLPVNSDGLRAGVAVSGSQYELGHEFASLNAHGTVRTLSFYGSYPFLRSEASNLTFGAAWDNRHIRDQVDATQTDTEKRAGVLTLIVTGDWKDTLGGRASSRGWLALTSGKLSIDTPQARQADAAGPRTEGGYTKWRASISRQHVLTPATRLMGTVQSQWAARNLDSSEKFSLGGAYGVRAYPEGEGVGDIGTLANIELRHTLMPALEASLFYDWGQLRINQSNYTSASNTLILAGYGLGLTWNVGDLFLNATLAWRDRQAALTAPDQTPRAWVQIGWRY